MSTEIWIVHRMDLDDPESYCVPEMVFTTQASADAYALACGQYTPGNNDFFVEPAEVYTPAATQEAIEDMRRTFERLTAKRR